jgi:hypothetical protein
LESDFQVHTAQLKQVAMEKMEREHHREIDSITTGQHRASEVCLKEQQLRSTTLNEEEWSTTMIKLEAELYRVSTDRLHGLASYSMQLSTIWNSSCVPKLDVDPQANLLEKLNEIVTSS